MIFQTTFLVKDQNLEEPLFTDLVHKGTHSTENKNKAAWLSCNQNVEKSIFLGSLGQK